MPTANNKIPSTYKPLCQKTVKHVQGNIIDLTTKTNLACRFNQALVNGEQRRLITAIYFASKRVKHSPLYIRSLADYIVNILVHSGSAVLIHTTLTINPAQTNQLLSTRCRLLRTAIAIGRDGQQMNDSYWTSAKNSTACNDNLFDMIINCLLS